MLMTRFLNNMHIVACMESMLNKPDLNYLSYFGSHEAILEKKQLLSIKNDFMNYLKYIRVYIGSPTEANVIVDKIMFEFLRQLNKISSDVNIRYYHGQLAMLSAVNLKYEIFALSYTYPIVLQRNTTLGNFENFLNLVNLVKQYFDIDLTTVNGMTMLGSHIMNKELLCAYRYMFYTPLKQLRIGLNKSIRFGIIGSQKNLFVGNKFDFHSVCSFDVKKFYLNILKTIKIPIGLPIMYSRNTDGYYETKPTRHRNSYANMLFNFIQHVIETEYSLLFQLYSKEFREGNLSLPVDCVVFKQGDETKKRLLSYMGCFYHVHWCGPTGTVKGDQNAPDTNLCHSFEGCNKNDCLLCCKSRKKRNVLEPNLFRLKKDETKFSIHPVKKMPYIDLYEKNLELENKNHDKNSLNHTYIYECQVIQCFSKPLMYFSKCFDIPIKKSMENVIFGDAMYCFTLKYFPLLRFNGKMKAETLINLIKFNRINGYLRFKCEFGESGKSLLSILTPFSFKLNDITHHGFDCDDILSTTPLISYLLNNSCFEFKIIKIFSFFEYKMSDSKLFEKPCTQIQNALNFESSNSLFVNCLKQSCNRYIGYFSIRRSRHALTYKLKKDDELSIHSLNNLIYSTPVDSELTLVHFKNNKHDINLSHLNMWVISYGKKIIMDLVLRLCSFLYMKKACINTDGFSLVSKCKLTTEQLNCDKNSLILDIFLRTNLCDSDIEKYVDFKVEIFEKLYFCKEHRTEYVDFLKQRTKTLFQPKNCCIDAVNTDISNFCLKMEHFGDKAVFIKKNRCSIYNSKTHAQIVKNSGKIDVNLHNIANLNEDDYKNIWP